jgi:hypothetical protein
MATKKTPRQAPTKRPRRRRGQTEVAEIGIARVLSALDKQIEDRFEQLFVRLIWRLGLASQKDVGGLSQRVEQLERRLQTRPRLRAVRRKPPAPSPAESGSSSSGNSAA